MIKCSKLKDIREDHDLSQQEMANILDVNRSTYGMWEIGINIIPLKNLCDFADYFGYSLDYVLGLSNKCGTIKKGLDLKKLGSNLKKLRIKKGLSQENIARMLDVTQACIVRYEKGLICISTSNLYKLSKELKVSLNKLCNK